MDLVLELPCCILIKFELGFLEKKILVDLTNISGNFDIGYNSNGRFGLLKFPKIQLCL